MLCVMCYVIKTTGRETLVTMIDRTMILGMDPRFGLSILSPNSKLLRNKMILIYFITKTFYLTI